MRWMVIGILAAAPLYAHPGGIVAQESPRHPMYLVRQEFVQPAQVASYEEQTVRWVASLTESRAGGDFQWVAVVGPELGYSYVVPIDGYGDIESFRERLAISRSDVAERWEEPPGTPTPIDRVRTFVISLRPDLSYLPSTVGLDLELPFRKYHWYHVIPGLEASFEHTAQRLVELYGAHDIEHGFLFYEFEIGDGLPIFLLVERADDEADYAARTSKILQTVGNQADALRGEMLRYTRRLEIMEGVTSGPLSYPPLDPSRAATLDIDTDR